MHTTIVIIHVLHVDEKLFYFAKRKRQKNWRTEQQQKIKANKCKQINK